MKMSLSSRGILLLCVLFLALSLVTFATLSKSDRGKKKKNKDEKPIGVLGVIDRGLVTKDIKKKQIIEEHSLFSPLEQDVKNFKGPVLGYVTPWNNHGYDVAKIFPRKFTHISPVWLQIKRKPGGAFMIEGGHDIDKGWINEVQNGGNISMVPRVLFDGWNFADFQLIFDSEDAMEDCIDTLVNFIREKKFPGVVLEIWSQLGGNLHSQLIHFLGHVSDALHEKKKSLILVIPPPIQGSGAAGMFSAEDFRQLVDVVDFFSLMTYDYTSGGMPGPNSPIAWVQRCIELISPSPNLKERGKILMGLNFYGTHYIVGTKVEPILGLQFVEVLQKQKPSIRWDQDAAEHVVEYKTGLGQHVIYYPTLYSIQQRLDLATRLGTGVSIWEIGQGLDYFYDLF